MFERFGIAVVIALLAGCGFRLAGQDPLPAYLQTIAIEAEDTRSEMYLALERELAARGVEIMAASPNRLLLERVETGQRVLSVSTRNVPREYEVYYSIGYRFEREGQALLTQPLLTLTRDYTWSEFEVLGKDREQRQLREAIVEDLVAVVLRQLSTLR